MSTVLAVKNEHSTDFAKLSGQYREQLFRAAHRITRTREDAEDAVQDTLLRAFVHLGDFEGRSNFGTWLTSIAVNSALMILRKKKHTHETFLGGGDDFGLDGTVYKIGSPAPNPETRCAQSEEERILKTAIQRLPPNLRVVVQIHLQGCLMPETAEALGISLPGAKGRFPETVPNIVCHFKGSLHSFSNAAARKPYIDKSSLASFKVDVLPGCGQDERPEVVQPWRRECPPSRALRGTNWYPSGRVRTSHSTAAESMATHLQSWR